MDNDKYTPGPLEVRASSLEPEAFELVAINVGAISIVKHPADAVRLAMCWNTHDELVAALIAAEDYLTNRITGTNGVGEREILPRVRAALSRAA